VCMCGHVCAHVHLCMYVSVRGLVSMGLH
jgi:hypothetical protein